MLKKQSLIILTIYIVTIVTSAFFPQGVQAAAQVPAPNPPPPDFSSGISIEPITAYNLVVDSNVLSPSSYGPSAASLGAKFCNTSGGDLDNVWVYIGDYSTPASPKPGQYPTRNSTTFDPEHLELLNASMTPGGSTLFSLTHESGSVTSTMDASRFLGTLRAGECRTQYWLVSYPRIAYVGGSPVSVTGDAKPDDDLWLPYDFWATVNNTSTSWMRQHITMRSEISASANKIWPNGDNKVPDEYKSAIAALVGWDTITPSGSSTVYPGQIVTSQGIWYDLGNIGAGFDNNNDYVPDHNLWLQPIGDPTIYDPGCFRLIRTYGILIIKMRDGSEMLIPFADQMYFQNLPDDNNGAVGLVFYQYLAMDGACTAGLTPYQEVASGFDNEKFNADFGAGIPPLQSTEMTAQFNFDKNGNATINPGDVIHYSLDISLPVADGVGVPELTIGDPSLGVPLVFHESVPAGLEFYGNVALTSTPAYDFVILYSTDNGATWSTDVPAVGTLSTTGDPVMIQWWMQDIPSNETSAVSISASFDARVPASWSSGPVVTNQSCLSFGNSGCFDEDTLNTIISGGFQISGTVFPDTGLGGGVSGNGLMDGTEGASALGSVTVWLYYDANNDNKVDAGDTLVNTLSTTAGASYSFTGLGPANYVVKVDNTDPDLPAGYTNTSPATLSADIVSANVTDRNFGFAPALIIDKQLLPPTPAVINSPITYNIVLTNAIPGSGGPSSFCSYKLWARERYFDTSNTPAGSSSTNGRWLNYDKVLGSPDKLYTYTNLSDNTDYLGLSGYNIGDMGGNITRVEFVANVQERANLANNDQFEVHVYYNNAAPTANDEYVYQGDGSYFHPSSAAAVPTTIFTGGTGSEYTIRQEISLFDTTGRSDQWRWSDFTGNKMELRVVGDKGAGTGDINLDAAGFIITTDQDCSDPGQVINPLPLTDTYESASMEFVSANPPISNTTTPTGTLNWSNLGPLYPGQTKVVTVTFRALAIDMDVTNVASTTTATFATGRPTNPASDSQPAQIHGPRGISGVVWIDSDADGWRATNGAEATDGILPNVRVRLEACLLPDGNYVTAAGSTSNNCANVGGTWVEVASQVTSATVTGTLGSSGAYNYSFSGLYLGFYRVIVDPTSLPTGAVQTGDPNETGNGILCSSGGRTCDNQFGTAANNLLSGSLVNLAGAASQVDNISFGYTVGAGVFGKVWENLDGDRTEDSGEDPLGSVRVRLYTWTDTNANNVYDAGDTITDTGLFDDTDSSGLYFFGGLTGGTRYLLKVDPTTLPYATQNTWTLTDEDKCATTTETNCATDDVITGLEQNAIGFVAAAGVTRGSMDFGWTRSGPYAIGDRLFYDWDSDAQQDVTDTGVANVTVFLYEDTDGDGVIDTGDLQITSTTTDANGNYNFTGLALRNYIVKVDTTDTDFPSLLNGTFDPDEGTGLCSVCDSRAKVTPAMLQAIAPSTTLSTIDFGYAMLGSGQIGDTVWRDLNGNRVQLGVLETGVPNIRVYLLANLNGAATGGPLGDGYLVVKQTDTDSSGKYLFSSLPTALNATRNNITYKVLVDSSDADLPVDAFGVAYRPTTVTNYTSILGLTGTPLANVTSILTDDFGFAPLAAIGDTIFWDSNNNGSQDLGEPGIPNVKVELRTYTDTPNGQYDLGESFTDTNGNGVRDAGEAYVDTIGNRRYDPGEAVGAAIATQYTNASGRYTFFGLAPGSYMVAVDTLSATVDPGTGAIPNPVFSSDLTSDPDADGIVCSALSDPADPGEPSSLVCDDQTGMYLFNGTNFFGADFGYQPGGVIGDSLWINTDGDDQRDSGEIGISYVTIYLCDSTDTLPCTAANANFTTATDANGYYLFTNIPAGTWYVAVDETDTDLSSLDLTQTFEKNSATPDNTTTVVLGTVGSLTAITEINGTPCSDCSLDVDFGYRYTGDYTIDGSVCLDDASLDGVCGTGGETAYANVRVILTRWIDSTNPGVIDPGEIQTVETQYTTAAGTYAFSGLPDGTYFVSISSLPPYLALTTQPTDTPQNNISSTVSGGYVTAARQQIAILGASVSLVDFAFTQTLPTNYDFGDLPEGAAFNYFTTLASNGPRHSIGSLYLGSGVTPETNGLPSLTASGETDTAAEGVAFNSPGAWVEGANPGAVTVDIHGTGFLYGWMDFNRDGDFTDSGETIISPASHTALTGVQTFNLTIPTGTFSATPEQLTIYSRFRIFESEPLVPAFAYQGVATNGEVEDYALTWAMTIDKDTTTPSVDPDGTAAYTIQVVNTGTVDIHNLQVTDTLPNFGAGAYTVTSVTTSAGLTPNFPGYDGILVTDLLFGSDTLPVGATATITIGVDLTGATPTTYDNTAAASNDKIAVDDAGDQDQDTGTPAGSDPETDEDVIVAENATISDFVWNDLNRNGIQEGGETGLAGVVINLLDSAGNPIDGDPATPGVQPATTTSDANGNYSFSVPAGSYIVEFVAPTGYAHSPVDQGADDALDSDAAVANGRTAAITLTDGEVLSTLDAGLYPVADLAVTKDDSVVSYVPGGTLTYTVTVTNTGPAAVTAASVSDARPIQVVSWDWTCAPASNATCTSNHANPATFTDNIDLTAGESISYTVTATLAADAVDTVTNTVTVTAPAGIYDPVPGNNSASDLDDPLSIQVTKTADPTSVPESGGAVSFEVSVLNNSAETVSLTSLVDDRFGNLNGQGTCDLTPAPVLLTGETYTCSFTVTLTGDTTTSHTNIVTATAVNSALLSTTAHDDAVVTFTNTPPSVTLDKSAAPLTLAEPGGEFTFTLTITNTSTEDVTITALTDDNPLSASCTALVGTTLAAGASTSCTYTASHTDAGTYNNTANVTVEDNEGSTGSDTASASVTVTDTPPTVTLDKSAAPLTLAEPGGSFTFTLTITNTSTESVTITALTDDNPLSASCTALVGTTLAAGASTSCSYTASHTDAGTYNNTASVTVEDNEGSTGSATDSASVTVTDTPPSVTLDKSAAPATLAEPGGSFTFTLTITNTSTEDVTITALTDDNPLSASCTALVGSTLAAGASTSCSYTASHTDAGTYNNTASVTVEDNEGSTASDTGSASVTVTDTPPTVTLDKSVLPASLPEPGGSFTFTLTITNTSAESVTITALTDDNPLSASCTALVGTSLAAGASTSCTYTASHSDAGTYNNTASVTVEDNEGSTASDTTSASVTVTDTPPSVALDKSAAPATLAEPGGDFTFTLTITNTSTEAVTITALTDDNPLSPECTALVGTSLAAGASTSCSYTTSHTDAGTYTNTASVTVQDNEGSTASDTGSALVTVTDTPPTVTLDKSVTPASLPMPGGSFTFTLTITNTSVEPVTITALTDDNPLSPECAALHGTVLAVGASASCSYTVTHTGVGSYNNTASVTVQDNDGSSASATDTQTVLVLGVLPSVALDKSVSPASMPEPGGDFTFTLTITNTSTNPVTIDSLTDDNPLSASCTALVGTSLAAGASTSCTYTVSHTDAGTYDNTASVSVSNAGGTASDTASASAAVTDVPPTVTLDKTVAPASLPEPGGVFTFTLTITNTSVEDVTITAMTDDNALSPECTALVGTTLTAGASTSCTYTVTQTAVGTYDNTASVTVVDNDGSSGTATDTASVSVTDVLPAVTLDKSVSPASLTEPGGDFTFTLTITNTSTVAVTITALTDDNPLSASCTALVGTSLAAGASTSCTYAVNHTIAGAYDNTASVTVQDAEGNTASATDTATALVLGAAPGVALTKSASPASLPEPGGDFTFTLTITNTSINPVIIDSLEDDYPLSPECIALVGTSLAAGASTSCTYTANHTAIGTYDNMAMVIVSNAGGSASDTASASVSVTDVLPAVTLEKSASPASLPEPGGIFTFTLTITNPSSVPVTIDTLTDDNPLSASCTALVGTSLAAGANVSCTYTVIHTDAGTYNNTAAVSVSDAEGNSASSSASASVSVTDVPPTVTLIKSAAPISLPEPGGVFTFTLTITNTSIEDVTITALTDDNPLSASCTALVGTTLAAGASTSCTYTVTHAAAGTFNNTASVTVQDNDGSTATGSDSATTLVLSVLPAVTLEKSVTPASLPEPGGVFTFTLAITNASINPVTIDALTDDNPLSASCTALIGTSLPAGATVTCTYTVTHTVAGTYDNTASVSVSNAGGAASDTAAASAIVTDVLPAVTLTKNATPASLPEPGGDFTFTLTITNPSIEPVTILALVDDNPLSPECIALIGTTLPAAGSATCSYTVAHTTAGTYNNTASVTVEDNEGNPASATDSASVTVTDVLPGVTLDKSVTPASLPEPGGDFTFTLTITNTSTVPVNITALTDDNPLSAECSALVGTSLAAGASTSCTYTVTHTAAGTYNNTASVTVQDAGGNTASASDSATVLVLSVLPSVTLDKSATPATLPEPGGVFTFTLTITNTSSVPVTIDALTDDNPLSPACNALVGTSLASGASASCTYTVTHTQAGAYDNTASVSVSNAGGSASDTAAASVTVTDVAPSVTLDKSVTPASLPEPGGDFTFTLTVTNTSVETVTITALTDDNPLSASCTALIGTTLAAGASTSCTYTVTHIAAGTYNNTATVTVQDNEGGTGTGTDTAAVTVTPALPGVTLDKSVTPASLPEPGGDFTFTLTVTNTSTVPVTITALTDDNPLSAECSALVGTSLAAGASTSCTYTVTHTAAGTYNNTASVTVQDAGGNTASASDSATVLVLSVLPSVSLDKSATPTTLPEPGGVFTFTLTITNTSANPVTITDMADDNPLSPACNALVGTTLAGGASVSCTYTVNHVEAGTYTNNASVSVSNAGGTASDGASASVTVTDALPAVTLDKSVIPATLPEPGGLFTFTLTVTNPSVETVTITTLTDDNPLSASCTALIGSTLAAGASTSCTYTVTHTVTGVYDNTASVTVQDNEGNPASDTSAASVSVTEMLPTVTLDKSVTPASYVVPGGDFTFTLTITNTWTSPVTITALTDDNPLSPECNALVGTVLPAGASVSCSYMVNHSAAGSYDNTATVTVQDSTGSTATASDTATALVLSLLPSVSLDKSASPATLPEPGGDFTFTLTITNTSAAPVTITALTDDNPLSASCTALIGTSLASGASVSCSYTVNHAAIGTYDNTASVTVTNGIGLTASDTAAASVTVTDVLPAVALDKSVSPAALPEPGGVFTFTLTVTNPSTVPVTITALTDDYALSAECTALIGTTLAAGASTSCTYPVTQTEAGSYVNNASVTVTDTEGNPAGGTATATITVTDVLPSVTLDKSVTPASLPEPGGDFTFTLTITNTSPETVTITTLSDTNSISPGCIALVGTSLAPGASASCTYTVSHTTGGTYDNTASVTVTDNEGNTASAGDSASVMVLNLLPSVALDKTVTPVSLVEPGGDFTFTLTITNTSIDPVTIDTLTDDNPLSPTCNALVGTTLAGGASVSCTYTVSHAEAGTYNNTASVTVSNGMGSASDTASASVTVTDVLPTITLVKSVTPASLPEPGGVFTYTITITNPSVEPVTITALTDTNTGECSTLIGTILPPGGSTTCTYTGPWTEAGTYDNTASVTAQDNEGNPASSTGTATVTITDVLPTATVLKTANPTSVPESGGDVTFTVTVTNTSTDTLQITSLVDSVFGDLDGLGDCSVPQTLPASTGTYSCTFTVTLTGDTTLPHNNTVTATLTDGEGNTIQPSDDATVTFTNVPPSLTVSKTANPASVPETGASVTFDVVVTNTSTETVTVTSLSDSVFGNLDGQGTCSLTPPPSLAAGASYTCSFTVTLTGDTALPHDNTLTATVTDGDGSTATGSDSETVTFSDVLPAITVLKTALPTAVPESGGVVTITIAVTNLTGEPFTLTSLMDSVFGDLNGQGTCAVPQSIPAAPGSYTCSFDVTLSGDTAVPHSNIVTAAGQDNEGNTTTGSDSETVTFTDAAPTLDVIKAADPTSVPESGGAVTFTVTVNNTSTEPLTLTSLMDSVFGDLNGQGTCALPQTLPANTGTYSCTFTQTLSGEPATPHANTITATGQDNEGNTATGSDGETVTFTNVTPSLVVNKAANPASVPETGGSVEFTITVSNPSAEAITLTSLVDDIFGDLNGVGTCAVPQTLAALGGSYTCTFTQMVSGDTLSPHTDTVTGTGTDNENTTITGSDSETVTFTNVEPVITVVKTADPASVPETGGDVTFTITVTNPSAEPVTLVSLVDTVFGDLNGLGTCAVPQTLAAGTGSYTCSFTVTLTGSAASPHTNTVTATGNDNDGGSTSTSDSETVTFTQVSPDLSILKSDSNQVALPGGTLTYTLAYENSSTQVATGVVITETVPAYTTFNPAASTPGWTCTPNNAPGSTCTYTVGTLAGMASGSITYSVIVDAVLPQGIGGLTNTAVITDDGTHGSDQNTDNNTSRDDTTIDAAPDLRIVKTDGVDQVSPGATLTYTLTVDNIGTQQATGVQVVDTLPAEMNFLSASDGGVFDTNTRQVTWPVFDLAVGASVTRTVTVQIRADLASTVTSLTNTSTVTDDGQNGSDDDPGNNTSDDTDRLGTSNKRLVSAKHNAVPLPNVAVGEVITYEVTLELVPGVIDGLKLIDTLDRGLAFVDCTISAGSGLTASPVPFEQVCARSRQILREPIDSTNPADLGRKMVIDFGSVTNSGTTNSVLTVRYQVVVLDTAENVRGVQLKNKASWQWNGGQIDSGSSPVTIVEPDLTISKSVDVRAALPGSTITYTLTLAHTPISNSDAFNLTMVDILPSELSYIPGSLSFVSGQRPTELRDSASPRLEIYWDRFLNNGQNAVIQIKATLKNVPAGTEIKNTASAAWTSLPGDVSSAQSVNNNLSTERTYKPGSDIDVYGISADVSFEIPSDLTLPDTGFAPGIITPLLGQPDSLLYQQLGDIWLEVPSLNLQLPIVGVPFTPDGWNVNWLNQEAGWLEETAFPGLEGNAVLTAHVYQASGLPGPFISLHQMKYGGVILLHSFGKTYRYEVRSVQILQPDDLSPLQHKDLSWLTLMTCRGYDEASDSYQSRVVVQAVLVSIE